MNYARSLIDRESETADTFLLFAVDRRERIVSEKRRRFDGVQRRAVTVVTFKIEIEVSKIYRFLAILHGLEEHLSLQSS